MIDDGLYDGKHSLCANCAGRPGKVKWLGGSGFLARTHGHYRFWCEICTLEAQLAYAQERAAAIPELEAALVRARRADAEDLAAIALPEGAG